MSTKHHTAPSQAAAILADLQSGEEITQRQASKHYGCDRLGARIHELRKLGHDIRKETIAVKRRGGGVARVARYSLPKP
jgi:Helix-turn-helix domain